MMTRSPIACIQTAAGFPDSLADKLRSASINSMEKNRLRSAMALAVLALPTLLAGCEGNSTGNTGDGGRDSPSPHSAPAAPPGSRLDLTITELRPRRFMVTVSAPGKIRANQDKTAMVVPIIEGKISNVLVGWGDPVKKGQTLAYLESVAVGEAKAAHFKAMADLKVADARLKRMQTLAKDKIIATKDLTAAEAERASAKAAEDATERALHVIGFTEEEVENFTENHDLTSQMPLIAPISGTIVKRSAVVGAWAAPPDELFTIMDLGTLWVDAEVFEKDLSTLHVGQRVDLSVFAYPGKTFAGRIGYISNTLDEENRTATVRTVLENPEKILKPGMFTTVHILTFEKKDVLLLPEGAVLEGGGGHYVVIEDAGRYDLRNVQVGQTSGALVEITGGLDFGEHVVTRGQAQIAAALRSAEVSDLGRGEEDD
ncbi:MAG: efflux RND transporter periplasmic adaptor subunit [Planctomycetota bacterium]